MASARLRWRLLRDLDEWLTVPMILLSIAWLAIVVWELTAGTTALLETVGLVIWVIFIAEFALRFTLAPEKIPFLKSNWLVTISLVIPALRLFRAFAILRAARGLRLVRIVGTANRSMNALKNTLERRGFIYVVGLTVAVSFLGAAGMLNFENAREVEDGFTSYGHALWWTGMLIASIGTENWPVTTEGRLLAMLLAIYGLAVFGYIAATFASFFIGRDAEETTGLLAGNRDMRRLLKEVESLRLELAQSRSSADPPRP
jgi:voltage-gated potassium channel